MRVAALCNEDVLRIHSLGRHSISKCLCRGNVRPAFLAHGVFTWGTFLTRNTRAAAAVPNTYYMSERTKLPLALFLTLRSIRKRSLIVSLLAAFCSLMALPAMSTAYIAPETEQMSAVTCVTATTDCVASGYSGIPYTSTNANAATRSEEHTSELQ